MPVPKGQRFGGRKKGTPNKVTLARAAAIAEENQRSGRKGCVAILVDLANQHYQLALAFAPHRDRTKDDEEKAAKFPPDEAKFNKHSQIATTNAAHAAQFETPKLQSTTLRHDAPPEPIRVRVEIV